MDREKVIKDLEFCVNGHFKVELSLATKILALLKEQEAKPLRCKECNYHSNDGWCNENGRKVKESDYCSFGAWEGR